MDGDEDITSMYTPNTPHNRCEHMHLQGLITRPRVHQLNYQVSLFLGVHFVSNKNMLLPNACDVLLIRNLGADHEGKHLQFNSASEYIDFKHV